MPDAGGRQAHCSGGISDDQSYPHASAYGYEAINIPAFDRVAKAEVLFHNAFTPAPGCSPMRAALLTGRNIWQLEQAGTHASSCLGVVDLRAEEKPLPRAREGSPCATTSTTPAAPSALL